jgi:hypothetical protein
VLGTVDGVTSYFLDVGCHYDPKQNLHLNPKGDRMVFKLYSDPVIPNSPEWVKGLKVQDNCKPGEELIVAWSLDRISVYTYKQIKTSEQGGHPKLETKLLHSFTHVTDADDSISFVLVLKSLGNFAVATNGGRMKAFKFTKEKALCAEFQQMARPIVDM